MLMLRVQWLIICRRWQINVAVTNYVSQWQIIVV